LELVRQELVMLEQIMVRNYMFQKVLKKLIYIFKLLNFMH